MEKDKVKYIFAAFIVFLIFCAYYLLNPPPDIEGFPIFEPQYIPGEVGRVAKEEVKNLTLSTEYKRSYVYGTETGFYIFEYKFYEPKSDTERMNEEYADLKASRYMIVEKVNLSGYPALYVKEREKFTKLYLYRQGYKVLIATSPQDEQLSRYDLERIASSMKPAN